MNQIKQITGSGIPVVGNDIDTDRIIPARFLRCVSFDGLGKQVFIDDRASSNGEHPFDQPQYQNASILVVNANFGCGSSREHAPQAIARWGIKAIVGESFAEIFFGNCVAMGLPCVTASAKEIEELQQQIQQNPQATLTVDLESMQVKSNLLTTAVDMPSGAKGAFLSGNWDSCGQLVNNVDKIKSTANKLPYLNWQAS